eukprot:TRINITY_DN11297_c0_g1_i1.p1 TRINITY_DN11297_c0_g1~~TRINITY_DN11297_c0_g1_i1.p1  ORF type:complete len:542 (-),score=147.90 TRINITY_DN11297_c0_g1_i1:35-1660(-)
MTSSLLKEGTKYLQGITGAVIQNLEAVQELSKVTRTSLGPNGMNKMVINRHGKLFVTNDAATIIREIDVVHPAARMCVMASDQQQSEIGDATNLVVVLTGELLAQAQSLLQMGLHPSDVIRGFEKSGEEAAKILDASVIETVTEYNTETVARCIKSAISSKVNAYDNLFSNLVAQACIGILPDDPKRFNVDNVRVVKVTGGSVSDSFLVRGAVIMRDSEGTIKQANNARVAVFTHGFEISKTDAKGTILVEDAAELETYNNTEENKMEEKIKAIADAGVSVVVCGGTISEMAMHFFERYNIMVVKTASKFELRRICLATKSRGSMTLACPTAEELGYVDSCKVQEWGSTKVIVFEQKPETQCTISTIVLRAATNNVMDDIEKAIEDGVNTFKGLVRDGRFLAGAGAAEIGVASKIKSIGESTPGQDQYAIKKYAEAFEVVARILSTNAGLDSTEVVSKLYSKHAEGNATWGVDIEGDVFDAQAAGILDHLATKQTAIRLATNAAVTILRISQIIMSKPCDVPVPGGSPGGTMGSMDQDAAM